MSKKRAFLIGWHGVVFTGLLLLGLLIYQQWPGVLPEVLGVEPTAAARVAQVWDNVRNSAQYDFAADVVVKTIPLATAENIGRFSKTDSLYLEGTNQLADNQLQMALWGDGVSVADRAAAYQVRVADGAMQTRVGDGAWQTSEENAVAFAPEGDFLAFLEMAQNVALAKDQSVEAELAVYTFDLDSRAYANKLTHLAQEQMQRSGQLPPGATVQMPDHLAQISGSGELWVDNRGLPVRQKVTMAMPAAANADYRTETVMDIHFSNYQNEPLLAAAPWLQTLVKPIAQVDLPNPSAAALGAGFWALALVGMAALIRPSRRVQTGVTLVAMAAMVLTPALQAQASALASDRFVVWQEKRAAVDQGVAAQQKSTDHQLALRAAAPYNPPQAALALPAVAPAQQSTTLDSDGDSLTDAQEALIGTSPYATDSDFDLIADNVELNGFSYAGKQWYGNPMLVDSNQDGVTDSSEWNPAAPDSDGDGTPDLYDEDNDGDGVPDEADISRQVGNKANNGTLITFSESTPLQLSIDGLNPGSYTFVDLQLRPTNPDRLWYAFNVFNWPKDQKGNAQDWDGATFFDYCKSTGGANCQMSPEANGDLKFVPMLEVTLPDLSNLPRRANGSLDTDLLNHYGIVIQPAGNGSYLAYVPLTLVEDRATGNKVAFRAQLVYQPGAKWNAQQARLVWTINLLNEQYSDTKTAEETLKKNGGKGNNQVTILHAYYDEFYLTGFNVREDRGVETAIVYEDPALDPAPNDDDALFQMTIGLRSSYLGNRDCDAVDNAGKCIGNGQRDITINTIAQRWNHPTNTGITDGQRWGIGDYLRVETRSFAHQDEATMIGGQQMAAQILTTHFRNTAVEAPALLFVRETRMRTLNADGGTGGPALTWNGAQVAVNFSGETVMAVGSYNLAPYRSTANNSGWEPFPTAAYADRIVKRYGAEGQGAPVNPTADAKVLADGKATYTAINITMNVNGQSEVLSSDAGKGAYPSTSGVGMLNPFSLFRLNLDDEQLRSFYAQAFSQVGSRMVWMNLIMPGGEDSKRIPGLPDETIHALFRLKIDPNYGDGEWAHVQNKVHLMNRTTVARYGLSAFHALLMVSSLGGLFGLSSKNKAGQTAGEAIVVSVGAVSSTIDAMTTIAQVASKLPSLGANPTPLQLAKQTYKFLFGVNSTIAKAGAVGAVIGLVITWVVFFAAWGTAGLATNSVAFNSLVAGAIAATLVVVVTFLVSLTVVGAIILAVFAIFDLFTFIACKAGAKKACDLSLTAAITKAITDWLYTGGVMIDTSGKPPISTIDDIHMRLTNPARGLVVGNGVQFEAQIQTLVHHAAPEPGAVYWWDNFFTAQDIQSTSVKYALGPTPQKIKTNLNETQWAGVGAYGWVDETVPSPVIGWLVPIVKTKNLWRAIRQDTVVSPIYPFAAPQINQTFPLTLSIGMALPTYDCWFQVCKHKSAQSIVNQDLSKTFVLDILPATVTDFHNWPQLGSQIDPDGDGLAATVDPNNQKWDTDSDGLPDNIELREGFDPRQADIDNDGLNDAVERRYGVNQWRADTDGDGLSDKQEIEGYPLTLGGKTILVVSDPTQRDSDRDGMSDGVERRLNGIDAVRYPFHPQVGNEAPARLYTTLNDVDRVLAVGNSVIVSTTIHNGTAVENALVASGLFGATLPAQLGGATQRRNFTLLPSNKSSIVLNGTAAAANGTFAINSGVAADLNPIGTLPTGAPDDIILDNPVPVTIDSDPPSVPALTQGSFVQPGYSVVIGGTASDPTSYIAQVEVSVNNGAFAPATGTGLWAFPVEIPNTPSGVIPVTARAFDAVNNNSSANFNLTIDGLSPALTVNLNPGEARQVRRNAAGDWMLPLAGTVSDALAGVDSLTLQIGDSSNQVYTRSVVANNGAWNLNYIFDDLAFNANPRPTGHYTLTVTARDSALPDGNPTTQIIPFVIDMTPPTVTLHSHKTDEEITDGAIFTGTVQDAHAAVQSVEVAFVAASTALSTGVTLLRVPLNDLPQTRFFANSASEQTRIYCLDATCPISGMSGADGGAASFDGNDLLRNFETLDLPESGLTTALWFKTTCANCGLLSMTQGVYPAVTERDRELYLDTGKVCSSILVNATRETRCTAVGGYANDQWHQVVHTLGSNGNALYVDGQLAASSPTTASTFTTQDGMLVGYAQSAATPFLTGALDDIVVYEGALSREAAAALYRQWQPVAFTNGQWAFTVPADLEGYYQIDMRASDSVGNYSDDRSEWAQFRGPIDTKFPSADVSVSYSGSGSAAQTTYAVTVRDANLSTSDFGGACTLDEGQLRYNLDPTRLAFAGSSDQLMGIDARCVRSGFQSSAVAQSACDEFGHCGAVLAPQTVAYIGTRYNRIETYGSLPNAIERTVLSDPLKRVQVIQRPGQLISDLAIDEGRGKIYWSELQEGAYAQPGQIWRANLDGSNLEPLVNGLTVYAPEALQIALDSVGNKLYWTKGHQLWWANLDGTQAQMVYEIPADPGFPDGGRAFQQIGDVAIDRATGSLYLAERRPRWEGLTFNGQFNHSLIVRAQLNGSTPSFVVGAGPGCTYANFFDNLGRGVDAGKDPTACVQQKGGMDVESLFVVDSNLYWSAFDEGRATSAVFTLPNGGSITRFANLVLGDFLNGSFSTNGYRYGPLPHLYVAAGSPVVFAMLEDQIVRGEPGGEFTRFSYFNQAVPGANSGYTTRGPSRLTALAVIRTNQSVQNSVQTAADLAVALTSPDVVLVDGQSGQYSALVVNNSALIAKNMELTLTLPSGATYVDATIPCSANGARVRCNFPLLPAQGQVNVGVNFTLATSTLRPLTASVVVSHERTDANPADNSASHSNITAAPSLTAVPGTPYIYSSYANYLVRVPLVGNDHGPEVVEMDNSGPTIVRAIAADTVRNKLIVQNNYNGDLATVNPDGSGYRVIANVYSVGPVPAVNMAAVVDESEGRVYWKEIRSLYLSSIRSAKLDGSDAQTHLADIYNQDGLLLDPVQRKLLWVATDRSEAQDIIYRSNLAGSAIETLYFAPPGRKLRSLSINPYTQKLYWLDPQRNGGTLFSADADGGRVAVLHEYLGEKTRGLVVRPQEGLLYFTRGSWLVRSNLDGSNLQEIANFDGSLYNKLGNVRTTQFIYTPLSFPESNLAFAFAAPFPPSPCVVADGNEPNNSQAQATGVGVGSFTASLCQATWSSELDQDVYSVTVPAGQQITITMQQPADVNYDLLLQAGETYVDVSQEQGAELDTVTAANYTGENLDYTFSVRHSPFRLNVPQQVLTNTVRTYGVTVVMNTAPPQTVFTNAQCAAVDSHDAPGAAGNGAQANATPLTVGQPITGALCYEFDQDYYKFTGTTGQILTVDLPVRPGDYAIYVYRPNGTLFNGYNATGVWHFGMPFTLDATGEWAVAVAHPAELAETLSQYQLLVADISCNVNDSYEPNNVEGQAVSIDGQSRVNATLCSAADQDYYQFTATAGQKLTVNYPADGAGGTLVLQNSAGATLGQIAPGTQGNFTLANSGNYRLLVAKSDLSGSDVPYMFQWLLDAPTVSPTATNYLYFANDLHLARVALSEDHTVEAIQIDGGNSGQSIAAAPLLGKLYMVEVSSEALIRVDMDGRNRTVIINDANPDNINTLNIAVAVDELGGRIYWLQPQGASASTATKLMSANLNGSDVQQVVPDLAYNQRGLWIDAVKGLIYWVSDEALYRSRLDGNGGRQLVRAAVSGEQVRDLALDPFAQKLYWLDPSQGKLVRANSDGSGTTTLRSGLNSIARGLALRPFANELYFSSGDALLRAPLNASSAITIATLSGIYQGPSNLNPGSFLHTPIGVPASNLVLGQGSPILSPCAVADGYEPNNATNSATPLTVMTETVVFGAICNSAIGQPNDTDYYSVTVPSGKVLAASLTQLPADYRLVIIHPAGYAAAFSENVGLADESGVITNTSGSDLVYSIVVLNGFPSQNPSQYKLTLTLDDVPPPPNPGDAECGAVDGYDAPGVGNGTLATATALTLDTPIAGALCYANDVDMYAFDGLAGQTVTIDLPTRPQDYNLTLYDPSGAPTVVISGTTSPAYGDSVTLSSSGRYTISVAQANLTPTTNQYQLVVTDENCVASDANEPNNSAAYATSLSNGSRVRASLCSSSDVDLYRFTATAGQQLTLNYPANATGATVRLSDSSGQIGVVNTGAQGVFTIAASGAYTLSVSNNALSGADVPYRLQLLLGAPTTPPTGSPYIYYGRVSDLIRADVSSGTVEPILTDNVVSGGTVLAADTVRGKLYIRDHFNHIDRVNFDGTGRTTVVADVNPNGVLRFAESLAVDELSGRIYWTEPRFGVVTRILSANGDGSDVREVIGSVVYDHGIAVDSVAGLLYWAETDTFRGVDVIRRSNLDGSAMQTLYAAPVGREIRELALDPFAQQLYWRDPSQNRLLWIAAEGGSAAEVLRNVGSVARGFVVRALQNELYFSDGNMLYRSALDGSNVQEIAQVAGAYNGVSNLDSNVFYPTTITPPGAFSSDSNLVLGYSQPFAQPCGALDNYEPNDSIATAKSIGQGTIQSVLCTQDLAHLDMQDHYAISVPTGKQISVILSDLPQDYGLTLYADGQYVAVSYQPGLVDETVAHVNNNANATTYTILVQRFADTTSSSLPYSLTVAIGDAPPPPPPPPPPADNCATYDSYDQAGLLGNGTRTQASLISFNTPITAALCYTADHDYYAFDGVIGQNVTLDLPTRPVDYYLTVYDPAGNYVTGIFPGSLLNYGDSVTLNVSGRWTVAVWYPNLTPTTAQYQLLLGVNSACSGLDPYEPNDDQFNGYTVITPTFTIRSMLCETSDTDWFSFPVLAGQRIKVMPRTLTPGMTVFRQIPGRGVGEDNNATDQVMSQAGNYVLGFHSQEPTENLPFEVDVEVLPVPTPTPLPNNWSCTTYPSSNVPLPIDDLTTFGSTVNVPVNGTVTHVGIKDLTFNHGGLWNLSFGLAAPDGTQVELFDFDDYGFYVWCGGSDCRLSLDDGAIAGLVPPQFPNDGNTFRPSRNSFAPFNGKASNGTWTLLVSDDFLPEPGDTDAGDTTGDLYGWSLEVCVDNGNSPTPPPTATATPTPQPQPTNGTPVVPPPTATPVTPVPTANTCVLTADDYENDDTPATAASFDLANQNSGVHTFDSLTDSDWLTFTVFANLRYTFDVNLVSGTDGVTLSLYDVDGTTHLASGENQVSFEPTVDGLYYLRAKSAAGMVSPCDVSYSIALTVINPNATPVPTPTGTPLPPGYDAPTLSAAILQPADSMVITDLLAVVVEVGLNAELGINGADLLVNDGVVESYPAAPSSQDATWTTSWTPSQAGIYNFRATIQDASNVITTSSTNVVYVDLANPAVTITSDTITLAKLASDGSYPLQGSTSDDSLVERVEVRVNAGEWQRALLNGNIWSYALSPASAANPNGGILAIEARATDKAGRTASASENVIVDITPPDPFDLTTMLRNGKVISPSQVISDLNARINWTAANGATSVYAGWTLSSTATLGELTAYGVGAGNHDQTMAEASTMYAHVIAVDANGNQRATAAGPFYFDSAATPDLIADLNIGNWIDSGGKQVGQMVTEQGVQKLFAGWDADALRLRWQGANVASGADLYLYLGTGSGGTTDLFDPNGPGQSGALPFAANYVVHISRGITPTLYVFNGGWNIQQEVAALNNGDLTDVLLPFADLGITNPGTTPLKVLGVAVQSSMLNLLNVTATSSGPAVWATIPDQNLGRVWTQYIEFSSLGVGVVPANGVWNDTLLEVVITADPTPGQLVGVGDAISVTVQAKNVGSALLPGLTVAGATSGGVTLGNTPQVASNLAPSGTVALTLNGTVNGDGAIALTLADSYHRPYLLETLHYTVDVAPPLSVTLAISVANPGINTAFGFAQDESAISAFDLEVNGNLSPCVAASGGYACAWNAGNAAENTLFNLRARATDVHGNVGWSGVVAVIIDGTAPQLTLSPATLAALSDGRLSDKERTLTGTLTDNVAAKLAELCSDAANCSTEAVQPDSSWTLVAPALGDGVTTTLSFIGYDIAGNASQPTTATVVIDMVAPQFGPTTINQGVYISRTAVLLGYGTVTDGGGMAGVQMYIVRPDGSSTIAPAQINGSAWTGYFVFDQVGIYQVVAVATDLAGNQATQVVGEITALYADIPPQNVVLTVRVSGSGVVTPSLSSYISGTVVPITATANLGWSFADWSGAVVTTTNPTTVRMDSDKIITATFTQNSYTLITATVGSGSIQVNPAQASYRYGDVITMTATANVGSLFSGWSGDVVGTTNPVMVTINGNKVVTATFAADSSAPVITPNVVGMAGNNGWYRDTVTLTWTVTDNESPIVSQSGCEGAIVATETAGVTFTCSAASGGGTNSQSVTIKLDKTAPVVTVTGVSEGASYALGSVPAAGCSTSDALAGVANEAVLGVTGGNPDGSGNFTVTCSGATDMAGNSASATVNYTVLAIPPTLTPMPTITPTVTVTPTVTPTPTPTQTPTPTPTVVPGKARITIVKDAQPNSAQNFSFKGPFGSFKLDDAVPSDNDKYSSAIVYDNVKPGSYTFSESSQGSWQVAAINCLPADKASVTLAKRQVRISVAAGDSVTCTFVNQRLVNLRAYNFNDLNGDRVRQESEPYLAGWEIRFYNGDNSYITKKSTNSSGYAETTSRPPGVYKVCETPKVGWTYSVPAQLDSVLNLPCHTVTVNPGEQAVLLFGNTQGALIQPADETVLAGAVQVSPLEDIDEEPNAEEFSEFVFLPLINR